jgi:hypothetical protein
MQRMVDVIDQIDPHAVFTGEALKTLPAVVSLTMRGIEDDSGLFAAVA